MKKIALLIAALWVGSPLTALAHETEASPDSALSGGLESFQQALNDGVGTYLKAPPQP